ncbi:MAG TPA: hypothetical protein VFB50_10470 [Chloroflexota bacterium]|nr:hypothetical protein [Chloroflexota bacterium]
MSDTDTPTLDPTTAYEHKLALYKAALIGYGYRWAIEQGVPDTPASLKEYRRFQRWSRRMQKQGRAPDLPYD